LIGNDGKCLLVDGGFSVEKEGGFQVDKVELAGLSGRWRRVIKSEAQVVSRNGESPISIVEFAVLWRISTNLALELLLF
jgi:hypothetical protein